MSTPENIDDADRPANPTEKELAALLAQYDEARSSSSSDVRSEELLAAAPSDSKERLRKAQACLDLLAKVRPRSSTVTYCRGSTGKGNAEAPVPRPEPPPLTREDTEVLKRMQRELRLRQDLGASAPLGDPVGHIPEVARWARSRTAMIVVLVVVCFLTLVGMLVLTWK